MRHNRTARAMGGLLLVAMILPAAAAPPGDGADPYFGDGGTSAFYRWDKPIAKPGTILRREAVGAGFYADHAATAERILYGSTDGRFGRGVVAASGLLYLPKGEPPPGGWPLMVWSHGTFGVADVCAPSWKKPTERDGTLTDEWVKQGFAVVAPDYQGLGTRGVHPYLQRKPEGYSVLDAARAALTAYPGRIANRVILTGQSQGSGAVLNASTLAAGYAPDLHLLGTIATALSWRADPVGSAAADGNTADASRYAVMRMMGGGLKPGSPSPERLLSARGKRLREAAATSCSRDLVPVLEQAGIDGPNAFTVPPARLGALLGSLALAHHKLPMPIMIATGRADAVIAPGAQYRAVQAMCRYGSRITWFQYDGVGHSATSNFALKDAVPYARALLAGRLPASSCGRLTPPGPLQAMDKSVPFNI